MYYHTWYHNHSFIIIIIIIKPLAFVALKNKNINIEQPTPYRLYQNMNPYATKFIIIEVHLISNI